MCMSVYVACVCIRVYVRVSSWVGLRVAKFRTCSWDPDSTRICVRRWPDTLAIRRPTHGMIWRSVPDRIVKIRRWFSFKAVSFHVGIFSYVFLYLLLSVGFYMLLLSFHVTFYYILPVWLLLSLLETSMIVHLIYVVDMSLYQLHFMC